MLRQPFIFLTVILERDFFFQIFFTWPSFRLPLCCFLICFDAVQFLQKSSQPVNNMVPIFHVFIFMCVPHKFSQVSSWLGCPHTFSSSNQTWILIWQGNCACSILRCLNSLQILQKCIDLWSLNNKLLFVQLFTYFFIFSLLTVAWNVLVLEHCFFFTSFRFLKTTFT